MVEMGVRQEDVALYRPVAVRKRVAKGRNPVPASNISRLSAAKYFKTRGIAAITDRALAGTGDAARARPRTAP